MSVTLRGFCHDKRGFGRNGALVRARKLGTTDVFSTYTEDHTSGEAGFWHFDELTDGDYRVDVEWAGQKTVQVYFQ